MDEQIRAHETESETPETKPDPTPACKATADLQAGEKVFTLILFLAGLFFFTQALALWGRMDEPKIASAAALPLFMSGVWTVLSFVILLENLRKKTPLSELKSVAARLRGGLRYAFPHHVLVMLAAIVVYCAALLLGVSFYIVTPLFLWGAMSYLTRGNYVKNILWTAIVMVFLVLVFRMLFSVIFP